MSSPHPQSLVEDESESEADDETSPMKALDNNQLDKTKALQRKYISLNKIMTRAGSSMIISIILSVSAAYGLHKLKFYGNKFVEYSLLVTYAFPGVILLVPIYLLFAKVNLLNTYFALIVVNVLFATPFAVWMLKAFFKLIPNEIEEAAYIDGASRYTVISRIIVPLAAPGIASVAIFCFIISWTEYLFASILISGDDLKTLPVGLAGIVGQYQIDWGFLLSGAVLASLPVILLFVFIGKYFVSGLTEGAVK